MARKGENIFKRQDGRWEARLIVGHNVYGKAIYRYFYAPSYSEARRRKNDFLQKNTKTVSIIGNSFNKPLVSDVIDEYLNAKKVQTKESTYARYYGIATKHIKPYLGECAISNLSSADISRFINIKNTSGRLDGSGGLSSKTVADILCVLKQILRFSYDSGYRTDQLLFPSQHIYHNKAKTLTVEDEEKLIKFVISKGSTQAFGVIISLFTGIRIGELCALRWSDIDMKSKTIYIEKTLQRIPNTVNNEINKTKIIFDKPKTNNSVRLVPIPSFLYSHFLQISQSAEQSNSFVLTGTNKFIEPSNYYVMYQRWLKECNISGCTFHTLRHTFATRCIEKGVDPKALSELLGHASIAITLSLYVHPSMEHKRESVNLLSELISSQDICQL